ncbi:MAG: nitrilase-related carbon-nitrogen hydrolase [Lachnospiraceae bacterium]
MKIACCQLNIKWEDKQQNMGRIAKYIAEASGEKADIILFPEMSLTGFSMNIRITMEESYDTVTKIKCLARQNNIAIGIGWVKACGEKAENHYTIINKNGQELSDYIKIHPFSFAGENHYFNSGKTVKIFELNDIKMCTLICYDLRFPETFQLVADDVSCIIVSANWPEVRNKHWQSLLQARAIENQVYMIGVNCVGKQQDVYYSGESCVINPNGDMIGILSGKEGNLYVDIPDDVEQYRNAFPMRKDRTKQIYIENLSI